MEPWILKHHFNYYKFGTCATYEAIITVIYRHKETLAHFFPQRNINSLLGLYNNHNQRLVCSELQKGFQTSLCVLQSQPKIVGTLPLNAVFLLVARLLILPMLFTTVNSLNLTHQHWEGKKTAKCPNNFDLDCRLSMISTTLISCSYTEDSHWSNHPFFSDVSVLNCQHQ